MNVNELMIGDIVRNTYRGETIYWEHDDWFTPNFKLVTGDDIEPVAITREFLEANGFVRATNISDHYPHDLDEEGYAYYQYGSLGADNPHIWFWFKDNEILVPGNCVMYMRKKYVHELQQLMRCTGLRDKADSLVAV